MIVACIGTREPAPFQAEACSKLGRWLVLNGHVIRSGNAAGVDQLFMKAGSEVDPTKVVGCLPWNSYERDQLHPQNLVESLDTHPELKGYDWKITTPMPRLVAEAAEVHPVWDNLGAGARRLHTRNGLILDGCQLVIACPSSKGHGGGTAHGIKVAEKRGVRMVNINRFTNDSFVQLAEQLRRR